MKVVHAVWEKENLGCDTYEILLDSNDSSKDLCAVEETCVKAGAEYLVVKTPVNCSNLIFSMTEFGYSFVETVYHVMVARKDYHAPELIARFDRGFTVSLIRDEENQNRILENIRKGIFNTDRISIDPVFGKEKASNRYANWTQTMMRNDCDLYEVTLSEKPIGFFIVKILDDRTVDPVLMGMYDEENDRGLGAILHKKMIDTCFSYQCDRLRSTIVSNNVKVFSTYMNYGASVTEIQYTYVKHIHR